MWPLHVIFFRSSWAFFTSWYNLVFFFIGWPLYNFKSSIPNKSASPFRKTTFLAFQIYCNDFRILCFPELSRLSPDKSHERVGWTCGCPKSSKKIQRREQWGFYQGSYPFEGSHSTSCSSPRQEIFHQIHEAVYGEDPGLGPRVVRAQRALSKGQDPENLFWKISHGLLPFLSVVWRLFWYIRHQKDELYLVYHHLLP